MRMLENEPMRDHTAFRVGGPARLFIIPEDIDEARLAVRYCVGEGLDYTVIGRGSNLLVADSGYDGAVICLGEAMSAISINGNELIAEAGAALSALANAAQKSGLTGLEFAAGIPGSLGGALLMNAGAYGGEMKDIVSSVVLLFPDGSIEEKDADYMEYGYRHSRAMTEDCVILGGKLKLLPGDREEIQSRMAELAQKRREKQPLEFPSAGSFFKRPEGHFAGALIEASGLKGYTVGGAQVSEKHAGFIINIGGAAAADIAALSRHVIEKVYQDHGVRLEPEVKTLGEFK